MGSSGTPCEIKFWAKTGVGEEFLSVERHLLDAGAVGARLFDVASTAAQRAWIADSFDIDVDRARRLVMFVVAAHDIGKVGPFQHQVPALAGRLGSEHLPGFLTATLRHDRVSGVSLQRFLEARGAAHELAASLAVMVSGHHSVPHALTSKDRRSATVGLSRWSEHQEALLDLIATHAGIESFAGVAPPSQGVITVLAGLVSIADWIASDAHRFPVTSGRREPSDRLASGAINEQLWSPAPVSRSSFETTFGVAPRAMQRAVVKLLDEIELPALVVIEERTGAGKTEAALWVAGEALSRGARGIYVGLPTRATAQQLHERAQRFLAAVRTRHDLRDLRLLHGGAQLTEDEPEPSGIEDASGEGDAAAREWFLSSRRGLLSPYAVGTIDQALLGVLRARFYPVRMWGLAGKVVIVDEAHAYDDYTGGLLRSLVAWLGALRCTVVILSATLPASRRDRLLTAFQEGLNGASSSGRANAARSAASSYPRITVATSTDNRVLAIADDRPGRRVRIEHLSAADSARIVARRVAEEVREGGCAAVVCSTVAIAQERYQAIAEVLPATDLVLLHARLRPLERGPVERRLVELLGPRATGSHRPARLVVIATQVIEQSLDLDFDLVVSDLAPIDLLIQRAGRVHRHGGRERPSRLREPRVVVMDTPTDEEGVVRPFPKGAGAIYVHAVLARTRAVLRDADAITEPADLDALIGAVYDSTLPAGLTEIEAAALAELDTQAAGKARAHAGWVEENGIGAPHHADPPWERAASTLADGDLPAATVANAAVTRWSERPSADIVVLRADEGHLADGPLRPDAVRQLMRRSVSVSQPAVVTRLLGQPEAHQPKAWRRHGALRHQFLSVLDDTNELPLNWDPVLGVIVKA